MCVCCKYANSVEIATCVRAQRCEKLTLDHRDTDVSGKLTEIHGAAFMFALARVLGGSHNPMKDYEVQQPPEDSISSLSFSPNANYIVASSWNNAIRCWEVQDNGNTIARAEQQHSGPVLDCCWVAVSTG